MSGNTDYLVNQLAILKGATVEGFDEYYIPTYKPRPLGGRVMSDFPDALDAALSQTIREAHYCGSHEKSRMGPWYRDVLDDAVVNLRAAIRAYGEQCRAEGLATFTDLSTNEG